MKFSYILPLIVFSLFANTSLNAQETSTALDLSIGNRWVYDVTQTIPGRKVDEHWREHFTVVGDTVIQAKAYAVLRITNTRKSAVLTEFWSADATTIRMYDELICQDFAPENDRVQWSQDLVEERLFFPFCGLEDIEDTPLPLSSIAELQEYKTHWNTYDAQSWRYAFSFVGGTISSSRVAAADIGFLVIEDRQLNNNAPIPGDWVVTKVLAGAAINATVLGDTNTVTSIAEKVNSLSNGNELKFFPNPVQDFARYTLNNSELLGFESGTKTVTIEVFDLAGRLIVVFENQGSQAPGQDRRLKLAGLAAGSYIARLTIDGIPRAATALQKL